MLTHTRTSNLSEALLNTRKIQKNFNRRENSFLDRDRNKIRLTFDRHMETFIEMKRQRHENWHRHDKHFREALRKEKNLHEKRKERNRKKLLIAQNPDLIIRSATQFEELVTESIVLPPINNDEPVVSPKKFVERTAATKAEQEIFKVLRESQKLLDKSATRARFKFVPNRSESTMSTAETTSFMSPSSTNSFSSSSLRVPVINPTVSEEYERLVNKSLERETFNDFVEHIVEFSPEFREQYARISEANKRQKVIENMRQFNRTQATTKDERYHHLIDSLIEIKSETKKKSVKI